MPLVRFAMLAAIAAAMALALDPASGWGSGMNMSPGTRVPQGGVYRGDSLMRGMGAAQDIKKRKDYDALNATRREHRNRDAKAMYERHDRAMRDIDGANMMIRALGF